MRWASRRMLPTVVGVSLATTIAADLAMVIAGPFHPPSLRLPGGQLVAAADSTSYHVAALQKTITPHLLVASAQTLPADAIEKVRQVKGVKDVEVVDAARAYVGGKRVGVLGVEPSTFRAYTPQASAKSDALWNNIAGGDVAISFTMGQDGGIPLASQTRIGGKDHQTSVRVGAYATMGIDQVDAVVSHYTAQMIGMPSGNALLVSAPHANLTKLRGKLAELLPKGTKTATLESRFDGPTVPGGTSGAPGRVMTAEQVNTVIRAAESKIGMPYVWGGESDREGGYDCSGLVQYAFAQAGIKMPRTADIQAFAGWRLPYSQAQPGDLLTWKNDPTFNGVSHIAIYLGNGKMVVARHTGTLIQIQNVYLSNFWGAIRVNPQLAATKA
ncbi:C40 family peptidase [Actinoallomurus spadix]|uniref:Peptidoglycan hydrolase RipC n=1 Tax=Actinoallomurus spadix TaxID=79912 RepID=A0ABP3GXX3_9ACTN|nr:C40 family peptidase [Actinoallomurus spadix]MCO5986951.1 C40 family peptidase [Actinoallomurus spadix]